MSGAFTPGPWHIDDDLRHGMSWNRHIVDPSGDNRICFMSNTGERPEGFANARLIAAAPELYEALEHDIRFFDSIANDERWEGTGIANLCNGYATRRRELLAKARGDQ